MLRMEKGKKVTSKDRRGFFLEIPLIPNVLCYFFFEKIMFCVINFPFFPLLIIVTFIYIYIYIT